MPHHDPHRCPHHFEALEARLLLSAAISPAAPRAAAVAALQLIATPLKRNRPTRPLLPIIDHTPPSTPQAPNGQVILTPPSLPGSTKIVDLSIGSATGKTAQPLGVNIGSLTAYAQGNVINNLITQGGGFEASDSRILVHVLDGSTTTRLLVDNAALWGSLGYGVAIGRPLIGSTGPDVNHTFTITGMTDQLDASGAPTGNVVIALDRALSAAPVHGDSFYVQLSNFSPAFASLADKVEITDNTTITRDETAAHSGQSCAAFTFGTGTSNTGRLTFYFGADNSAGRNILQLGHTYQFSFWAKTASAANATFALTQYANNVSLSVALTADNQWHQYSLTLTAGGPIVYQNGQATIQIAGTSGKVNVDDAQIIDLSDQIAPGNPLSKQVVSLIKQYGFGDLRFWIPELRFASLDDLIGPAAGRPMIASPNGTYDPLLGLPEMLELAKETHTAAWIVIPTTWSAQEMQNLMEYLAGGANTVYGAKRIADGHAGSWFSDLTGLYLEAGNESWNGIFAPNAYFPFEPYFARAQDMFHAVKTDPLYAANASKIQLIVNGWQAVPWFTQQAVLNVPDADAVDVAAYTTGPATNVPLTDLLADGLAVQQSVDATTYPPYIFGKKVYVYEESIGELGTVPPAEESAYATSLGAGLSVLDNAMTLTRDYGMSVQNLFTLIQRGDSVFGNYVPGYYGLFADLTTAATNPRPVALGAELLDNAKGDVLASSLTSGWLVDATSSQSAATTAQAADAMVTFDGHNLVITLFNKAMTDGENTDFHFFLPTLLDNKSFTADWADASFTLLAGPSATSNNETADTVQLTPGQFVHSATEAYAALPAHSMASLIIPITF